MSPAANPFRPALFSFLRDLEKNNEREWFQANKGRYEDHLKDPALRFISDFGPALEKISPHFMAIPKTVKGSLFRIYRDTRFAKDKTPYKTFAGLHFRHKQAKDVHAPGFYLHLEPRASFAGVGIWHPDSATQRKVRDAIVADPASWKRAVGGKRFRDVYELSGETLKRPPKGYDPEHPLVEDLKRKDFTAFRRLTQKEVLDPEFPAQFARQCKAGAPFVRWLCDAVGVPF